MKILIISPKNKTIFNFRGDLIRLMIACGNEVVVTGPNDDYLQDILNLGVTKFLKISLIKDNTSIFGDFCYYKRLKIAIKEEQPDLVFSYTIKPVIYGSLAAKSIGIKKIFSLITGLGRIYTSDNLKTKIIRVVTNNLYRKAFNVCDKVIFQNIDDLTEFVSNGFLPIYKATKVNGSGVNMSRFKKTVVPQQNVFLMVSRIIAEKGVLEFCQAAQIIKKHNRNTRFVLLGGFELSINNLKISDIQTFIDKGIIEYLGEVKDPVIFYQQCSVFVLPTYYREGIPRTILEAMSTGRAIITTDWPGCREAVIDGENGFLVSPRSVEELANKMQTLISDRSLVKSMGEQSFQYCRNEFEVSTVNEAMRKILEF